MKVLKNCIKFSKNIKILNLFKFFLDLKLKMNTMTSGAPECNDSGGFKGPDFLSGSQLSMNGTTCNELSFKVVLLIQ